MRRKQEPVKYCETCERLLIRKYYNGRLEDLGAFLKRKYCSLSCANTKKNPTDAGLRWRAEQLRKESCEICGAQSNLHAHHIDGNISNNLPENIQTLCIKCHGQHHHWCRKRGITVPGKMGFKEWLPGYPLGWTDLNASETP